MSYRNDGYIDLFRNGGGHTEKKMEKVLKYEIQNDCKVKFFALDQSKIIPAPSCSAFSISVINLLENKSESIIPFTIVTCESYNIGSVTHLDYNPR